MSDPVIISIRAQRMALNLAATEKRPAGWNRKCAVVYREAVFICGSFGALLPALLMLLVAAYAAIIGISLLMMMTIKLLGSP